MNTVQVITAALQIAIANHKANRTVDQALKDALAKLWYDYNSESQPAAERAIKGYYQRTPAVVVNIKLPETNPESKLIVEGTAKDFTKKQLLEFGVKFNVKLPKTGTKDRLLGLLQVALVKLQAA